MKNDIEDTSQSYSLAFEFSQNIYVFISLTEKRSTFLWLVYIMLSKKIIDFQ